MKTHKYRAQKTEVDGITFHSKKEANYYKKLLLAKKAGEIKKIELQPRFNYSCEYYIPITDMKFPSKTMLRKSFYKADFKVFWSDGQISIYDVKGFKTKEYKQKKKIIEYLYDIEIIEV